MTTYQRKGHEEDLPNTRRLHRTLERSTKTSTGSGDRSLGMVAAWSRCRVEKRRDHNASSGHLGCKRSSRRVSGACSLEPSISDRP